MYDTEEMSIFNRMKCILRDKHEWEHEDFEGMTFLDVEACFLDVEEDFR